MAPKAKSGMATRSSLSPGRAGRSTGVEAQRVRPRLESEGCQPFLAGRVDHAERGSVDVHGLGRNEEPTTKATR